jgi:5-methyltetrahydropteroyltriglutamate--homocysteine methyltransferase
MGGNRISTTPVGSLIRPPELLALIEERQDGRTVDQATFEATLRASVAEVVRLQAESGIDVVSDGDFGKTGSWSRYILERLGGFEFRPGATACISSIRGKDYRDFEEFYLEYEGEHGAAGLGKSIAPTGGWAITGPIRYTGQAQVARDIANLKTAVEGAGVMAGFLPVVAPASVVPNQSDEHYRTEEEALFAIADALHDEYAAIVQSGLLVQIDDAFLASTYDVMVPPHSMDEYRRWAALRVDALNHALRGIPADRCRYHVCWGKLERTAHQRCAVAGHRRSDPARKRRGLLARNGESASRTRMARVGDDKAARGQGAAARRDQPRDQRRRTS